MINPVINYINFSISKHSQPETSWRENSSVCVMEDMDVIIGGLFFFLFSMEVPPAANRMSCVSWVKMLRHCVSCRKTFRRDKSAAAADGSGD